MIRTRGFPLLFIALATSLNLPASPRPSLMPEERRAATVQLMESFLNKGDPALASLFLKMPDPFLFGRVLPEGDGSGGQGLALSREDVFDLLVERFTASIDGVQRFGQTSALSSGQFGLLREGSEVTLSIPDVAAEPLTVLIRQITSDSVVLEFRGLEKIIPLFTRSEEIQRVR